MSNTKLIDVADKSFDYVIVGGGTAGLTLAARLSEDPSVTVLVLEAGRPNLDDPNILVLGQFGKTFGDPNYDWAFSTVKQQHSNDREIPWSRGKGLGGSSAMNFYVWVKPCAADMNAIERLGNPGWGWESYLKYTKKSETFNVPPPEQDPSYPLEYNMNSRGSSGPIQTCFPHTLHSIEEPFQLSMRNMGLKSNPDPYSGDNTGSWVANINLDPKTFCRSYAATAYYQPNRDRPNLTVLTEATVVRVLFADRHSAHESLTATGVEFHVGSDTSHGYVAHAKREVILSAGAIKSPQLLELSGIGRRDILDRLGVDVKIDLPGVGENVQEHVMFAVSYELKDGAAHQTYDMLRDPEFAAEQMKLRAEHKGILGTGITPFTYIPLQVTNPKDASTIIAKAGEFIEEQKASGKLPAGLAEQYDLQLDVVKEVTAPDFEIIGFPGRYGSITPPSEKYVSLVGILNHPLSRGTIHAVSPDPTQPPQIDPHYFECDFDMEILVQHWKFIKAFSQVEPWKSLITCEVDPGPKCNTEAEIREYIKETLGTTWHTVGSCSMMPRDKQGVVDPELKVYGTQNLRVVDISIIPLHIAAHTQATAYVIGEKAADLIRGAH